MAFGSSEIGRWLQDQRWNNSIGKQRRINSVIHDPEWGDTEAFHDFTALPTKHSLQGFKMSMLEYMSMLEVGPKFKSLKYHLR